MSKIAAALVLLALQVNANPYWDPKQVPKDAPYKPREGQAQRIFNASQLGALEVLRVRVDWTPVPGGPDRYVVGNVIKEMSGTPGLLARSRFPSPFGSYVAVLLDTKTGQPIATDQIGTGQEYRKLVRALSFRFPVPTAPSTFELYAENPKTGVREKVLSTQLSPFFFKSPNKSLDSVEVKLMKPATVSPSVKLVLYADGYLEDARAKFWTHAQQVVDILSGASFPELDRFEITAVFAASSSVLGAPADGPNPVTPRNSYLGLYYPYWEKFGRWYNVVYPTSEEKYRAAIAVVPYDYPMALINDSHYWGVGNFRELTAIPMGTSTTAYLLLHEFGHFFGLNEEYEGGGPTELEFAPQIEEPWSQNLTFIRTQKFDDLKWKQFSDPKIAIPTPSNFWSGSQIAAYKGGYGDSAPQLSHKPGFSCTMDRGKTFCPVCKKSIKDVVLRDSGLTRFH